MAINIDKINSVKKVQELSEKRRLHYEYYEGSGSIIQSVGFVDAEQKLKEYMSKLTFDDIKFLQVIMYLGRDTSEEEQLKYSARELFNSQCEYLDRVGWTTKEGETAQIFGKMPLDEYLEKGLSIINIMY